MKKLFCAFAAAAAAAVCIFSMSACSSEEGNKVVSDAKDYLQSEIGFNGNVSDAASSAKDYLKDELGLNNTSNTIIEGTWTQEDETNGDWEWTFDGTNKCSLKGITTGFEGSGTYSVDETAKTVTVNISGWEKEKVYTYKLSQTLSDTKLDLTEKYSSYHLKKNK